MAAIKVRQLADLAIGFPASGHVNFSALHCLLMYMAEKMGITDDTVNYCAEIANEKCHKSSQRLKRPTVKKPLRLIAGLNPEDDNENDSGGGGGGGSGGGVGGVNETPNEPHGEGEAQEEAAAQQVEASQPDNELTKEETTEKEEIEEVADEEVIEAATETTHMPDVEEHLKDGRRDSDLSTELRLRTSTERIHEFETIDEDMPIPDNLLAAISILRHQLEFVTEQLLLLTFLTLSKKPESQQIQQLYAMTQTLNELRKENIPIKDLKQTQLPFALALDWVSSNLKVNEEKGSGSKISPSPSHDTLESHLCYSPAKLLDQLMTLKSEFCLLTNKVNELSARMLEQEGHHLLTLVQESHKQMRDIRQTNHELKDNQGRLEIQLAEHKTSVDNLKTSLEAILERKVDKTYFDTQLDRKADCKQLQGKASLDQLLELQCRIDKRFGEILNRINDNDNKFTDIVENLRMTLGPKALEEVLAKFKENITNDMQQLNQLLSHYIASTDDHCAAAGARVRVLQDLACLSCASNCVMPIREKAKVAKLPSAHASNIISPLVTYELGSIRKSGIMGYYRKDEFPHAPNAWQTQQSQRSPAVTNRQQSPSRHAGGQQTPSTTKERLQKSILNIK